MSKEENKRQEGARTKQATSGTVKDTGDVKIGGEWKFQKEPQYLKDRMAVWDELYAKQEKVYEGFERKDIKVTMPDGKVCEGKSFETSPFDIATKNISKQFAEKVIVAKVKYTNRVATLDEGLLNPEAEANVDEQDQWFTWDVLRKLEGDCHLKLFRFDDAEGKETFWHSSAHILGETLEMEYGVHLCHGPPTDSGFFYDSYCGKDDKFAESNYKKIEEVAKKIVAEKQTFSRLVLSKEESLRLFGTNPFKVQLISSKIPDGGKVTAYKCGKLIDLCTGPHIPSTKVIKAFKVMKNSSAYWLGKAGNDSLQRVYGVTFPSKKEMDEYVHLQEEAAKRDHRRIGREQKLFEMHEFSPGSAFFHPKGAWIYNELMTMIRDQYKVRGFQEVVSPNLYNLKLWKTSGHYVNYKDCLFALKVENQGFGMKPMNCPGHCLMFKHTERTYRELPIRFADFGVLHRNELSGALTGLTRVRRFCQDDAHQFCAVENIMDEIMINLDFLDYIYGIFGFKFELELSTRPEKKLGSEQLWDQAEAALEQALNKFGHPWKMNPGDGAFYGPKIDIKVYDALKRAHQCGTVQLDFQLPIRFNLQYKTDAATTNVEDKNAPALGTQMFGADEFDEEKFEWKEQKVKQGYERPVMIHRAILGSVERFFAILCEHTGGKWPFFMSPRQIVIIPIDLKFSDYCHSIYLYLHGKGYQVDCDFSSDQLKKKIRNGQVNQYNFIICAGEKEMNEGTVDIRTREEKRMGTMRIDKFHEHLQTLYPAKSKAFEQFYAKAWDPAHFSPTTCDGGHAEPSAPKQAGEKMKLYVDQPMNHQVSAVQAVADLVNFEVNVEVSSDKAKNKMGGGFPFGEASSGQIIGDALSVMKFMADGSDLMGSSPFEQAKVNQWIGWCQENFQNHSLSTMNQVFGVEKSTAEKYTDDLKLVKQMAQLVDGHLKNNQWLAGSSMTLADIVLGSWFKEPFQTIFDDGFRKSVPSLTKWFQAFAKKTVKRFGNIKMCAKALKPATGGGDDTPAAAPEKPKNNKKGGAKKKEEEADMDDLFGDDGEDEVDAKAIAAKAKEAATKKKVKKPVIAQSLVLFEVKPLDDKTNIDEMAKDILAIKMDGLYWKTQYRKEPVAYGIFKLIIGCTVEDEKVSVDGLVEMIEAIEDKVQSVEIAAFNKV